MANYELNAPIKSWFESEPDFADVIVSVNSEGNWTYETQISQFKMLQKNDIVNKFKLAVS